VTDLDQAMIDLASSTTNEEFLNAVCVLEMPPSVLTEEGKAYWRLRREAFARVRALMCRAGTWRGYDHE